MKTLINSTGAVLAISEAIETDADRLRAGIVEYPFAALGDGWQILDGEPPTALHTWDGAQWVAPLPTPAPVPEIISPRQFRQSLTHFAFRTNIENAITASDQDTKDWYEFATQFERHHPMVISMAQQLGYTDAQIDDVWTYGAAL